MDNQALRRQCEATVDSLDLPDQLDLYDLCDDLGRRRNRPIHLLATTLPSRGPCGMWVGTGTYDAIFYEKNTSPLHQQQIIAHECGHLLAGHRMTEVLDADASRLLLPDLDPNLVHHFLGRTTYSALEEREAEMIASLLVRRIVHRTEVWNVPRQQMADTLDRVSHALTHSRRGTLG
jgi:hypothetical protein